MSETDTDTTTTDATADLPNQVRKDVRRAVADSVETRERATVAEVVTDVAARFGVAEAAIKDELGHSPDYLDAVMMAVWARDCTPDTGVLAFQL